MHRRVELTVMEDSNARVRGIMEVWEAKVRCWRIETVIGCCNSVLRISWWRQIPHFSIRIFTSSHGRRIKGT